MDFKSVINSELEDRNLTTYRLQKLCHGVADVYNILRHGSPSLSTTQKIVSALGGEVVLRFPDREYKLGQHDGESQTG